MEQATISLIRALRTSDATTAHRALDQADAELDQRTGIEDIPQSIRSPSEIILRARS
jgi:hypothetical protein